jgi:hypothetical protein
MDQATPADLAQVIAMMAEDKSNDWTEEIAVLENIEKNGYTA